MRLSQRLSSQSGRGNVLVSSRASVQGFSRHLGCWLRFPGRTAVASLLLPGISGATVRGCERASSAHGLACSRVVYVKLLAFEFGCTACQGGYNGGRFRDDISSPPARLLQAGLVRRKEGSNGLLFRLFWQRRRLSTSKSAHCTSAAVQPRQPSFGTSSVSDRWSVSSRARGAGQPFPVPFQRKSADHSAASVALHAGTNVRYGGVTPLPRL